MATDTAIVNAVKAPLENAFAGSGFLYAVDQRDQLIKDYRLAFEKPGGRAVGGEWVKQFDRMLKLAYTDLAGTLKLALSDNLDKWMALRAKGG
jgi:hypothetical protein